MGVRNNEELLSYMLLHSDANDWIIFHKNKKINDCNVNRASIIVLTPKTHVWFLLFKGISTFVDYLIPKPTFKKKSSDAI